LDLPFDFLMLLLENEQIYHLLRQRITALVILNANQSSQITFGEEHIPIIASTFTRLRELFVDLTHLSPSIEITSEEDVPREPIIENFPLKSCQQSSMDSMIMCLFTGFKDHKLIDVSVDGEPSEKMKADAKQWLQENTILCRQPFEAVFNRVLNRLLVWM
jgi:hypothetical protein